MQARRCGQVSWPDLPAGRQGTKTMKYYVYILLNAHDYKFYTGITNDIKRRLREHQKVKSSTLTTLGRKDFFLVHLEECLDRTKAREREKFWKSGYGRELRNKFVKGINLGA
jgi:putative endonuclease